MTSVKVQTADLALALAGGALAVAAAWRPGIVPAWLAFVPIGALVLGTLALIPHQVLVAHEGWASTRQGRKGEEHLQRILEQVDESTPKSRDSPQED